MNEFFSLGIFIATTDYAEKYYGCMFFFDDGLKKWIKFLPV